MKLAEALIQRKAMLEKIESLRGRIVDNAKVQEGDRPGEDPLALLGELEGMVDELGRLIVRINETNNQGTPAPKGLNITASSAGTCGEILCRMVLGSRYIYWA